MNCNCQNNASQTCGCDCGCTTVPDTSACCCGCGCNDTCNCTCNCNNCCNCCSCNCNCNCNSGCNQLYKCNCLRKYIASLTQRINEYSAYLEANPCDRLAACLVCEAKQELAAAKNYYCQHCNTSGTDCLCNEDCNCGCDCGCC